MHTKVIYDKGDIFYPTARPEEGIYCISRVVGY